MRQRGAQRLHPDPLRHRPGGGRAQRSPSSLLLYAVFHIGNATNNISWKSYEALRTHPAVDWAVPISLGDSHRGFRVVGTDSGYFEHVRYGDRRPGRAGDWTGLRWCIRGGDRRRSRAAAWAMASATTIVLAHGAGEVEFCRARRQALHCRRGAGAHRHTHGPQCAGESRRDRGDPPRLAGRRADTRLVDRTPSTSPSSTSRPRRSPPRWSG